MTWETVFYIGLAGVTYLVVQVAINVGVAAWQAFLRGYRSGRATRGTK